MAQRTKRLPSSHIHQFGQVPAPQVQRSTFNRSASYKTTFNVGELVPFLVEEVLPGDSVRLSVNAICRMATPLKPLFDNLYIDFHFFFVPNRQVWENWEKFMGEQEQPGDSTDFLMPTMEAPAVTGWGEGTYPDYVGLPTKIPGIRANDLPRRGYLRIVREWYRDQNLQNATVEPTGDGNIVSNLNLRKRVKRADYFTRSLPFPQKGESVDLPLGELAPVILPSGDALGVYDEFSDTVANIQVSQLNTPATLVGAVNTGDGLQADLSKATAATINQLRQSFQIQKMLERDARGGTRYPEILMSHFGVQDPAYLVLQRPMYLGGGTTPINIAPVPQTSGTPSEIDRTPQGNLAAVGTGMVNGNGFVQSFTEHGYVHGIMSVRADLSYQQGIERHWSRQTRFDFFFPALAHIGEQAVLSKEIYADGTSGDEEVWGYQERWAEYRYGRSKVTGLMRSNADQPLDVWHLAQDFANRPTLSEQFILEDPPIKRTLAIEDEAQFIFDGYIQQTWARPLPVRSVPGLVDHF